MINAAIMGIGGRMGSKIFALAHGDDDIKVVGATEVSGSSLLGQDAGTVSAVGGIGVEITDDLGEACAGPSGITGGIADGIIDFTVPVATLTHARYAAEHNVAMVIGTTGFSPEQRKQLEKLADGFPCVLAPNMSIGVNVMFNAAKKLAQSLGDDYDVEIVEAHHRNKVDAPSGTALKLAEVVANALGRDIEEVGTFSRHGAIGPRGDKEIGIQTIRGGDIVGEHTVMFIGTGERIELTHRAASRDNFASGAIRALKWVVGRPPGLYSMDDVLGL